jgi:flagellar hook-basal body complex protein FliE
MTAPLAAVPAIGSFASTPAVTGAQLSGVGGAGAAATAAGASSGVDFATALAHGIDAVSASQAHAGDLAVQAATGTLTDPAQLTIAMTQAQLMTQLATTVESKAVAAFNQIMGMQA